jgi:hypothetical protein
MQLSHRSARIYHLAASLQRICEKDLERECKKLSNRTRSSQRRNPSVWGHCRSQHCSPPKHATMTSPWLVWSQHELHNLSNWSRMQVRVLLLGWNACCVSSMSFRRGCHLPRTGMYTEVGSWIHYHHATHAEKYSSCWKSWSYTEMQIFNMWIHGPVHGFVRSKFMCPFRSKLE